ncbi:MAG: signal transduction histidine kinase [Akkermansiaceae bacterium]
MSLLSTRSNQASRRLRIGAILLAALTFLSGLWISRKTEFLQTAADEGWLLEEQQVLADSLKGLEREWEQALSEAALIESKARAEDRGRAAREIMGVRQISYFSSKGAVHEIVEFPLRGAKPQKPALSREEGDFILSPNQIFFSVGEGHWIEGSGETLLYSLSSKSNHAVVLTLRSDDVLFIAEEAIRRALSKLPRIIPDGGYRQVLTPAQSPLLQDGDQNRVDDAADEAIRQFSRFGSWTIRYWRPRTQSVHYDLGILLGSFLLAIALASGGWWAAREQAQALRLAEERVSFVNAVSHELRTPLTNILLSTELVEDELTTPKSKERLQLIKNEGHRLSRMVENVLGFARSDKVGIETLPTKSVSLEPFVLSCIAPFQLALGRKDIHCDLKITGGPTALLNEDLVSQIIFNLLSNIQKYAEVGTQVWIHASCPDDCIIEVGNSAPIIPEKFRSRIFLPFERLDNDITNGTTGTGLGLSISRDLARNLGGDLILKPSSSETIFRLTLPQ